MKVIGQGSLSIFVLKTLMVVILLVFLISPAGPQIIHGQEGQKEICIVSLEGTITSGSAAFMKRVIEEAQERGAEVVIVTLNTPGGLVDATLELNRLFLNADIPIVVYVAPSGAIAASAGAFILLSSDIAVMAPGTSTGAARPIAISPEGAAPAEDKTVIFLAGHMRELAEQKGRPPELAERFITENLTLGSSEAFEKGVINIVSPSLDSLIEVLDGYSFDKQGQTFTISTRGASRVEKSMNPAERLQSFVSDPQIAFLLLMGGLMLLYLGFSNPGTFVPEVLGGISLILAIYGMGLFDTNIMGILLIAAGIGLLIAEAFTAGFGIMGIGGAVSLLIGALLLPLEPLMEPDWYRVFMITVGGTVIGITIIMLVIIQRVIKSRRESRNLGESFFRPPETAVVVEELNPDGMVKSQGEIWRARSADNQKIPEGKEVTVLRLEELRLIVRPAKKDN